MVAPEARSRALWRRQVILTALAVFAFAGVAVVTRMAVSDWGRQPQNRTTFLVLALALGAGVVALLTAACIHAFRIAQLVFSRGETD